MADEFDKILSEMEKCYEESPDAGPHIDADDLLVRTIRLLAQKTGDSEKAEKIVSMFEKMTKWYE